MTAAGGAGATASSGGSGGAIEPECVEQCPFERRIHIIPGRIEAEHYDTGGLDIAYSDTTPGNEGAVFRSDDVDIKESIEGGYAVGWFDLGEWLEYTVDVAADGTYLIAIRVGSMLENRTMHVEFDGDDVTGPVAVPLKAQWDEYDTVTLQVTLTGGPHVMRVAIGAMPFIDLNWLEFD